MGTGALPCRSLVIWYTWSLKPSDFWCFHGKSKFPDSLFVHNSPLNLDPIYQSSLNFALTFWMGFFSIDLVHLGRLVEIWVSNVNKSSNDCHDFHGQVLKVAVKIHWQRYACSSWKTFSPLFYWKQTFKILQSMMNAKLSVQKFWQCHESWLCVMNPMLPLNLYVDFKFKAACDFDGFSLRCKLEKGHSVIGKY